MTTLSVCPLLYRDGESNALSRQLIAGGYVISFTGKKENCVTKVTLSFSLCISLALSLSKAPHYVSSLLQSVKLSYSSRNNQSYLGHQVIPLFVVRHTVVNLINRVEKCRSCFFDIFVQNAFSKYPVLFYLVKLCIQKQVF